MEITSQNLGQTVDNETKEQSNHSILHNTENQGDVTETTNNLSGKETSQVPLNTSNLLLNRNGKKLFIIGNKYGFPMDGKYATNFLLKNIRLVTCKETDEKFYLADVHIQDQQGRVEVSSNVRLTSDAFTSPSQLEKVLGLGAIVHATGDKFSVLKEGIHRQVTGKVLASSVCGLHGDSFLTAQGRITKDGLDATQIMLIDKGTDQHNEYAYPLADDNDWKETATKFLTVFPALNEKNKSLAILGWGLASILSSYLTENGARFPILNVYGTKGSGKSSTIRLLLGFMGYRLAKSFSASKLFTPIKKLSMYNASPIWIDEFRESNYNSREVKELVRAIYDNAREARGKSDQSSVYYDLVAPFIISGEDNPDDQATQDRMASVHLKPHQKNSSKFRDLDSMRTKELFIGRYIQWLFEIQEEWSTLLQASVDAIKELKVFDDDRPFQTGVCIYFGLQLGLKLMAHLDIQASYTEEEAKSAMTELARTVQNERPTDVLLQLMYQIREYYTNIFKDYEYSIEKNKGGNLIGYFKQSALIDYYMEKNKVALSKDSIRKKIQENIETGGYILSENHGKKIKGSTVRTLAVDLTKLCKRYPKDFELDDWWNMVTIHVVNSKTAKTS